VNLRQLRFLVGVADSGFNISHASATLHTSQPGIGKQIRARERELDVTVFVRNRNRILGLTEPGKAILSVARRMLRDAEVLKAVGREFNRHDVGNLVVATTHIYARYVLVDIIAEFKRRFPAVELVLRQGNPHQIADWVVSGEADLGIAAEPTEIYPDLVSLPGFRLSRSILARRGRVPAHDRAQPGAQCHRSGAQGRATVGGRRATVNGFGSRFSRRPPCPQPHRTGARIAARAESADTLRRRSASDRVGTTAHGDSRLRPRPTRSSA